MKYQMLPLIANLTIIGSPMTFMSKVGAGVNDFINLPAEGYQSGPLSFGKGLAKGTGSVLKNTFEGAANSL